MIAMKDNRLQTEPVPGLLFSLALPAVCAQIVTLLYNMVDRMYIGRMAEIGRASCRERV